jgi:uncharacterized protein YecT (DUF1311 family)
MTRLKALVFTFLMGGVLAVAQTSELDRCMDAATTQAAMNRCAGEEANRVDAQLNLTYRQVLHAAKGDVLALAKIRNAERTWITYRNAYMEAMYPAKDKQANYGSMYPMNADLVLADLTRAHVQALKTLLRQYSGQP